MAQTNKKSQELDVRTIMQGLEEFACFMSFQGSSSNMRIISVETLPANDPTIAPQREASVLAIKHQKSVKHKSLSFSDRPVH